MTTTTATKPPSAQQQIETLRAKIAAAISQMRALTDKADAESRDLNADEQSRFNTLKQRAEVYKAQLEGAIDQVVMVAGNLLSVRENGDADPTRGFAHVGEFAASVASHQAARRSGLQQTDQRLIPLIAAPGTAGNEGSGSDGGILVPTAFSQQIYQHSLDEDSLIPLCDDLPIEGNSMVVPKDETTPWSNTGPRANWVGENTAAAPTKPVITGLDLRLKKLLGLVPMTNELLSDSTAMAAYLPDKLAASVRWKSNEAVLFGSGAGVPLGAFSGPAVVTILKDPGQATMTLSATNLANMIARLPPGSMARARWLINNDVLPALLTLTLGNFPIYLPCRPGGRPFEDAPGGRLLGLPVIINQHSNTFSSQGDVQLVDLRYYQAITKSGGVQMATSMHLYFDADATAFRISFRMDGAPKLTVPITPNKGNNKLSPFVQLGAR